MEIKYIIKEDENYIIVTKKIKRYLAPFFAIIGIISISIFFLGYQSIFNQVDSVNFFGITVLLSIFTSFIDLFLVISGGFLMGSIYFCCWTEGWEINKKKNGKPSEILFFWGFANLKKTTKFLTAEIDSIYVQKIPLDELETFFIYKLQFLAKITEEKAFFQKTLLIDSDYNQIHSLGLKTLSLLQIEFKLLYK